MLQIVLDVGFVSTWVASIQFILAYLNLFIYDE